MIPAAFVIPVAAVVLVLTLREPGSRRRCSVHAQSGSYAARSATPLSVTAFRIANTSQRPSRSSACASPRPYPG